MRELVAAAGGQLTTGANGTFVVTDLTTERIGQAAAGCGVALHELTPVRASLEKAFMNLTANAVEFQAAIPSQETARRIPAVHDRAEENNISSREVAR